MTSTRSKPEYQPRFPRIQHMLKKRKQEGDINSYGDPDKPVRVRPARHMAMRTPRFYN